MKYIKAEILVGLFVLLGIIASVVLALKVAGLVLDSDTQSYKLYAKFDGIFLRLFLFLPDSHL